MNKFIAWTGRMDSLGTLWPACSIGSARTVEEAIESAREWQHRVLIIGRTCNHCIITTYGAQKIVAGVIMPA